MRYLAWALSAALIALPLSVTAGQPQYASIEESLALISSTQKDMFTQALADATPSKPETLMLVADMYRMGIGTPQNTPKAFKYYDEASKLNYGPAQASIAQFYLSGIGIKEDKKKGIEWLQRAAKNNSAEAMVQLSVRYMIGDGVEKSEEGYNYWRNKAESLTNTGTTNTTSTRYTAPRPIRQQEPRPKNKEFDRFGIGNL